MKSLLRKKRIIRKTPEEELKERLKVFEASKPKISKSDWSPIGFNTFDKIQLEMVEEAYKDINSRKREIARFNYLKAFSNEYVAIYRREETKEIVFAIKGTSTKKELLLDLSLIIKGGNIDSKQFVDTYNNYKRIKSIFKDYTIWVSGHSLGGLKAFYIGNKDKNVKGSVFNMYVPVASSLSQDLLRLFKGENNLKVITVIGDPLSNEIITMRKNVVKLQPKTLNKTITAHLIKTIKRF